MYIGLNKQDILRNTFGYDSFRPGQEDIIDSILSGRDVLAVMPTGAGKSLCYQIPALLMPGMTVVISPLISLMKDQVNALREAGCPAAFLNSSLTPGEYNQTMDDILNGEIKLLYIAPERLQKGELSALVADRRIPLVVVDEAHCVSQWGHDFRPGYLQIADFIRNAGNGKRPVTAAFTATATAKVGIDIENLLALRDPFYINTGFDRPNLYFEVQKPENKSRALLAWLGKHKNSSGIIYCATRKNVEEVCNLLLGKGFPATRYHAGLEDYERRRNQDDFLFDRKTVMVATNAFGMGIDKSNVSYVIHYNMPKNIESYYQEAGRAGRDGAPADCILLYSGQDVQINKFLITHSDDETGAKGELVAHNLELLKQMTFYAAGNTGSGGARCLRQRLLAYFGEEAPDYCGHCSNCLSEFEETDVTLESRKIVSCVYRLKERNRSFGKMMIIDILRGSKNEKILRFGLDSLSTWGIMKDTNARRIRTIIDHLLDEGILLLEDGEYPIVIPGRTGELLREERRVLIKLPKEKKETAHNEIRSELKPVKQGRDQIAGEQLDTVLLEKLKKLRRELASKEAVPPYVIFHDTSLQDMCLKMPVSLIQFSDVNGVGNVKLEKYGGIFTELIREYTQG